MATTTTTNWQISATGSDTNGGCFDPAMGGTDYSFQNTAQLSLTDVVTTTASTTATSATGGFTSAMIGNGINIASTVYQITAVTNTNTITLDRTVTTGASGQTGKVGGALASPGFTAAQLANCTATANDVYMDDSGTYAVTSATANISGGRVTCAIGGTSTKPFRWIGHKAGDRTDRTSIPTTTINFNNTIYTFSGSNTVKIEGMILSGSGGTSTGINLSSNHIADNIRCQSLGTVGITSSGSMLFNCRSDTCGAGYSNRFYGAGLWAYNCTTGFSITSGPTMLTRCVAVSCTTGFAFSGSGILNLATQCTAISSSGSGFSCASGTNIIVQMTNCLSYGNGAYGFTSGATNGNIHMITCAGGGNTSGNVNATITENYNFVTLTASPFTNSATLDFSINNVAGGGALIRNAAYPLVFGTSINSANVDIGAVQHAGSSQFGVVRPNSTWAYVG